jgi:murein DD-endopeptidase MepM/ murein hydrolase activator NlpD
MSFGVIHTNLSSYNVAISSIANTNTNTNKGNNSPSYQIGRVYGVVTTENTPTKKAFDSIGGYSGIGTIFFKYYDQSKDDIVNLEEIDTLPKAIPLYPQNQYIPLVNELVYLIDLPSSTTQISTNNIQKYYITINLWNNPQQNAQPSYDNDFLGTTFLENPGIRPLIPYQGDYIVGGRQGSSLRFSTTTRIDNLNQNEWSSVGNEDDPITILTNGLKFERDKQFYIERINKDNSSIYLTSAQKIPLQTDKSGLLNNLTKPQSIPDYFNSSQAILNADRVIINSKKDEVMLFAKTNVEINTKNVINLNADTRVHLNTDSIFLGPYDPNALPQPVLLGKETIILFEKLLGSLTSLADYLSKSVGVSEGTPMLNLVNAGTELFNNLEKAYDLLENIPSKRIFVAPNNAIQNNQSSNTPTSNIIQASLVTTEEAPEEAPAVTPECEDLRKLNQDERNKFILEVVINVLGDQGKSKKYTDVIPLDGGTVGIVHFAKSGFNNLYKAMGDSVIQKYFGATINGKFVLGRDNKNELLTVNKMIKYYGNSCRPAKFNNSNVIYNDTEVPGWGCYSGGHNPLGINWRQGMEKFVNDKDSKGNRINDAIQRKAVLLKHNGSINTAIENGWKTRFEWAVAIGIANSGGLDDFGDENNWDAKETLDAYVKEREGPGKKGFAHRDKRRRLIKQYYPPCPGTVIKKPPKITNTTTTTTTLRDEFIPLQASFIDNKTPLTSPYFLGGYKIGKGLWPLDPTAHDYSDRDKKAWFDGNAWDIFAPPGTPVYSPIDGVIVSTQDHGPKLKVIYREDGTVRARVFGQSANIQGSKLIEYSPKGFNEDGTPKGPITTEKFIYNPPDLKDKSFTYGPAKEQVFLTHLKDMVVKRGQTVKAGDLIGYIIENPLVDNHVHIGIRYGDNIRKYIADDGKGTIIRKTTKTLQA